MAKGRFIGIQYLRGAAALAVVFYHADQFLPHAGLGDPHVRMGIAAAGVDVFFVISGFIMWTTARDQEPFQFARRRIARIVPLYWAMTALMLAIYAIEPGAFASYRPAAWHIVASFLFIPALSPAVHGGIYPVLIVGWTLQYEMFFYALFSAALFLPQRSRLVALAATLAGLGAVGSVAAMPGAVLATYTNPLLIEFLAGIGIAEFIASGRRVGLPAIALMAAAALALFVLANPVESAWRPLAWGLPALLVVAAAALYEARAEVPDFAPLRLLGDASYSLYLSHLFAVAGMALLWRHLGLHAGGWFIAAPLAAVTLSMLVWQLVEQPGTRMAMTWPRRREIPLKEAV